MPTDFKRMTGEQLLQITVLGGADDRIRVQQELKRRSLWGPPRRSGRPGGALPFWVNLAYVGKTAA